MSFKQVSLIVLAVILIIGILVWLEVGHIFLFQTVSYRDLPSSKIYYLTGNARLAQSFESRYPGLYQIDIYFSNPSHDGSKIFFRLKDSCATATDLQTIEVHSQEIQNQQFYHFIFSPIYDSINRNFCLVLETRPILQQTGLGVYASNDNTYPLGAANYKDNTLSRGNQAETAEVQTSGQNLDTSAYTHSVWLPIVQKGAPSKFGESDIAFQLYYKGPALETVKLILTRLSDNKPNFWGFPWFYIVLLVVYLINLGLFLGVASREKMINVEEGIERGGL